MIKVSISRIILIFGWNTYDTSVIDQVIQRKSFLGQNRPDLLRRFGDRALIGDVQFHDEQTVRLARTGEIGELVSCTWVATGSEDGVLLGRCKNMFDKPEPKAARSTRIYNINNQS